MSRIIEGEELQGLQPIINLAVEEANNSPCAKSKRGAVVFDKDFNILGSGHNHPHRGSHCRPDHCYGICRIFTVHAEEDAIDKVIAKYRQTYPEVLSGASILHIKSIEGRSSISGDPSCSRCSGVSIKHDLREFILLHENGFVAYTVREFHDLSLYNEPRRKKYFQI